MHRVYVTFAYHARWTQKHRYYSPHLQIKVNDSEEVKRLSPEQTKEDLPQPPPTTPTKTQKLPSPSSVVTPKAVRNSFARSSETVRSRKNSSTHETAEVESEMKKSPNLEHSKNITNNKTGRPPSGAHPPNNLRLKSPDSPRMSGKASPTKLRLPKLAPSPTPQETIPNPDTSPKVSLPKLIEPSMQSTRVAH
ncbi:uncharacterized protein LOC128875771 [Hylaeus volcanicus]|uniref:uncharacterized protein LOC128875771 n=1 Tax=Hylaeus volcanicus TaxID=313075 RepID=UPI0023B8241F|nr:uncharacterized protein LOC128875771 [Hylaeus volcanicus]